MPVDSLSLSTRNVGETETLGKAFAALLPEGALVALIGELGAGKTCFVRGVVSAHGEPNAVSSPTFTLVNEYPGAVLVRHLDLYRLGGLEEIVDLGYEELFDPREGVTLVEWAEKAEGLLPAQRVDVRLEHVQEDERRIEIVNRSLLQPAWRERLSSPGLKL
ncbi:MAG: tRNA (adenosine(37)-N6)-threonylcarbamoyltransferase complex ATPase subunit type 1 TsaE [Candidatus Hydrogenedentes bacterium]|jgi:tRNA threonylcarbamoyladenosine biosynthesis protein TsaE|nr:tRNA (adenosine(37)-N6)-threonylcarbamoyltransferase complex ATPase subunit type 1 TsaE [Candidatus Hydrogenedentota bacterium]